MVGLEADSLRVDCLLNKPRDHDWSEGCYEDWEVIHPFYEGDFSEDEEENEEKRRYYNFDHMESSNLPMMNYYYPLYHRDSFGPEDAKKINHLPLCIIYFTESEEYALALTGGGMDLSWQICEAYMRLGYYPPVHFRLPRMAGKARSERNLVIVDACIKSREIVAGWQASDIEDLERTREYLGKSGWPA